MKKSKPLYAPFIDIGIKKIQEYIELSRKSKIYALASEFFFVYLFEAHLLNVV
jgi:hypothetical protein